MWSCLHERSRVSSDQNDRQLLLVLGTISDTIIIECFVLGLSINHSGRL